MTGGTVVQKFAEQNCVEQTHCNMLILRQGRLYADVANDDGKFVRQSKLTLLLSVCSRARMQLVARQEVLLYRSLLNKIVSNKLTATC